MSPKWKFVLNIADIWNNEDLTWDVQRNFIVRRIKRAKFYNEDDTDFVELVEELEFADDVEDFDNAWSWFYDWADANRVWVNIFS